MTWEEYWEQYTRNRDPEETEPMKSTFAMFWSAGYKSCQEAKTKEAASYWKGVYW